jgi:hypothetical protein
MLTMRVHWLRQGLITDAATPATPASEAAGPTEAQPPTPVVSVATETAAPEAVEPFVPDPSYQGAAPSAEAYAQARAALAAKLIGSRYGEGADEYIEHVRLAVHAMSDELEADKAIVVSPPPPTTVVVPVPVVSIAEPAREKPRRHRRTAVILWGTLAFVGIFALGSVGLHELGPSGPDPTATPSPTPLPFVAVGTHATPSPTPSPTPTPVPTKAPTKKPVVKKATPKPTPRPLFATWVSLSASTTAQDFQIQTLAGASCRVTRSGGGSGTSTSGAFTANSAGLAHLASWTGIMWRVGRTYTFSATCTLSGRSATTPTPNPTVTVTH